MIRDTALTVISAVALILGACGYSGQDEPNESGTNRSEAGVEPARETTPDEPQAGTVRDPQESQGEYTGEMDAQTGTGEGETQDPGTPQGDEDEPG